MNVTHFYHIHLELGAKIKKNCFLFFAIKHFVFNCQAAEALGLAARNHCQTAEADREAMSAGGKDSEAEAFDFSIAVVSLFESYGECSRCHFKIRRILPKRRISGEEEGEERGKDFVMRRRLK